ncbi:MAG: hypothetical protein Q9208_001156 [Pyrenodesmia sp. 3 TL-2023]
MSPSRSSRSLIAALTACLFFVSNGETYTEAFEADFFHLKNIKDDPNWQISAWPQHGHPYAMSYEKQNVIANPMTGSSANGGDPGLQMVVRGPTQKGSAVSTAEMKTVREDMHYGSYRVALKYSRQPGTCGAMFWYKNDTHEIDIELLSHQETGTSSTSPVNFVLHADGPQGFATPRLPFHPSDGFHEYRFDWSPKKVSFYADGQFIQDLTQGVPVDPGFIMLNHWSNGNAWTKGPPTKDVTMTVAYVKAYFNKGPGADQSRGQCDDTTAKDAVCEVPDYKGPISPDQKTVFLTKADNNILPINEPTDPPGTDTTDDTMTQEVSPDATCGDASAYSSTHTGVLEFYGRVENCESWFGIINAYATSIFKTDRTMTEACKKVYADFIQATRRNPFTSPDTTEDGNLVTTYQRFMRNYE